MNQLNLADYRSRRSSRRGAAFLLIVAALLLVVTGVTFQAVRSESLQRKAQRTRLRAETMLRAIDAASVFVATDESSGKDITPMHFPIDETQWIRVSTQTTGAGSRVVAEWVRNEEVVDTISRELDN
ncbi:MAG: hypothetical protein AAGI63_05920 [Planctomycetota bacterium]